MILSASLEKIIGEPDARELKDSLSFVKKNTRGTRNSFNYSKKKTLENPMILSASLEKILGKPEIFSASPKWE